MRSPGLAGHAGVHAPPDPEGAVVQLRSIRPTMPTPFVDLMVPAGPEAGLRPV